MNIVLCFPASGRDVAAIQAAAPDCNIILSSQQAIPKDIFEADIFCGHAKVPVDWAGVVSAGRLRWIQSSAAGLDHCLVPEVCQSAIPVSGCSGLFANQVAEQTLALLAGLFRRVPDFAKAQDERRYERLPTDTFLGRTFSIIGFGGNGRRIASMLRPIAGTILATDCFPQFDSPDFVQLFPASELNRMFSESEIVIVTLPLTDETRNCIGHEQFQLLAPESCFINVARGQVVDHQALWQAIEQGKVGKCGLDVFDPEPPPASSPFWRDPRVLLTPHVGAQSPDRETATTRLFCENLDRFRHNRRLVNLVDKSLQFPHPADRPEIDIRGSVSFPQNDVSPNN